MHTAQTEEFKKLAKKYPYIVAWGRFVGSHGYYILRQMQKAEKANAPSDAIYERDNNSWSTYSNCSHTLQLQLDDCTKGGAIIN